MTHSTAGFAVNGRYLTHPVTGVQRYARNVVAAVNAHLSRSGEQATIVAPSTAPDPCLSAMPLRHLARLGGHPWEQLVLPASWPGPLLNLCNTAPALKSNQVVCIHDTNVFNSPDSYSPLFRNAYKGLFNVLARSSSVTLTTVSSFSASQIARFLPVRVRDIVVLPNGHEHALAWDPARAAEASKVARDMINNGRHYVLALGSRARHKNLQLLLGLAPAMAELGLDLVVAGGGAGIYAEQALQLAPSVKTIGYVTDDDLAYLMQHALCLAFPSLTEGFGLPILEAMARGCPVISSNRASMPEVCGGAALMAAPDDPALWLHHLRTLMTSPERREHLIGLGREQARRFSWAATAAGYVELMNGMVSSGPRKPVSKRESRQEPARAGDPLSLKPRTGADFALNSTLESSPLARRRGGT